MGAAPGKSQVKPYGRAAHYASHPHKLDSAVSSSGSPALRTLARAKIGAVAPDIGQALSDHAIKEDAMGRVSSKGSRNMNLAVPDRQVHRSNSTSSSLSTTSPRAPESPHSPYSTTTGSHPLTGSWQLKGLSSKDSNHSAPSSHQGAHGTSAQSAYMSHGALQGAGHPHHRTCRDCDFIPVHSIHQAYPFHDDKKNVVKRERATAPMQTGHMKNTNFGHATVTRLSRTKIHCEDCGRLIADRTDEKLWYCCGNCRAHGRHYDLCVACHEKTGKGGLSSGNSANFIDKGASPLPVAGGLAELVAPGSQIFHRQGSKMTGTDSREPMQRGHSRSLAWEEPGGTGSGSMKPNIRSSSKQKSLSTDVLSGIWSGNIHEGNTTRHVERQIYFFANGSITGSGAEGCTLSGRFSGRTYSWVETYEWGTMELQLDCKSTKKGKPSTITGSFHSSDGGSGLITLNSPPPELQVGA
mmetsp:Transcript_56422/g.104430  ORF Transcript_56422/g.104430 Transcript_56422/m.104430 type:complete len:467 (+) Transcript_56422:59-1459(+)